MKPFYKKITAFFRNLDLDEQEAVLMDLSRIYGANADRISRKKDYVGVMERLTEQEITGTSRKRDVLYARVVVAYEMAKDGYSEPHIARILHRDHSTINYYKQMMSDTLAMPVINQQLHRLYKRYKMVLK